MMFSALFQMIQQQQGVRFNHDLQGMQPLQGQPPYGQQQQQYMNNPAQYMQYQQMQQQVHEQVLVRRHVQGQSLRWVEGQALQQGQN